MACKDLDKELNTMLRYNFNNKNSTHISAIVKEDKIKINSIHKNDFMELINLLKINEFVVNNKYKYTDHLHIEIDLKNNSIWDINDVFEGYGVDVDEDDEE